MREEKSSKLDEIYTDLSRWHDELELKLHLGGMEVRDKWEELETDWTNWTHQLKNEFEAKGENLEESLRKAGGEDLQKLEERTKLAVQKLKDGFKEIGNKLEKM